MPVFAGRADGLPPPIPRKRLRFINHYRRLLHAGTCVACDSSKLPHGACVALELGAHVERLRHSLSIVDDSLKVKNQMPAAMATIATTIEVASGTSGSSPTPMMPHRNVATTDAIGLM